MSPGYRITDQYLPYYTTLTVVGWVDLFTRRACKELIVDSLDYCVKNKGLIIYAFVLMESHLHLVVSAKEDSIGLSGILRDFKKFTSRRIIEWIHDNPRESRRDWLQVVFGYHAKFNSRNKNFQVWQQHNQPKLCMTQEFTEQKINYIHYNPVKAGIVDLPEEYRYSSARNYAGRNDYVLEVVVPDYALRLR